MRTVLWALLLGGVTSVVIGLAETYLPNSYAKGAVIDAFALPGAIIAGVSYPEGPHTGFGARYWGLAVLVLNFVVYFGMWLALLALARRWRRGH